jgi:quercetin dioxygenase-like cupin family protein
MALHHVVPGEKVRLASVSDIAHPKTAALVKTDAFEAAQLFVRAGDRIASHAVPGYATLYCIEGAVVLHCGEDTELRSGDWLYLDRGQEHSLSATEDSSLLLTILFE